MAAATPTAAEFRARFPAFKDTEYPDELVTQYIELAGHQFSLAALPWLYLTAHLLACDKADGVLDGVAAPDGGRGIISVEDISDQKHEYSFKGGKGEAAADHDAYLDRTAYGRHFRQMKMRNPARAIAARVF